MFETIQTTIKGRSLLIFLVILIGIALTVYVIRQQQTTKTKAATEITSIIDVRDNNGNVLQPQNDIYKTSTSVINIHINDTTDTRVQELSVIACPSNETLSNNTNPASCQALIGANNIKIFFDNEQDFSEETRNRFLELYSNHYTGQRIGNARIGFTNATRDEFVRRSDYIIQTAKGVGLNPTLFLGYWKTESRFSLADGADLGCDPATPRSDFENEVDCAMKRSVVSLCALSRSTESTACQQLKYIRDSKSHLYSNFSISYPITTFNDFAEAYGSFAPNLDGPGTVNHNCSHTYNELIKVALELDMCRAEN